MKGITVVLLDVVISIPYLITILKYQISQLIIPTVLKKKSPFRELYD